MQRAHFINTLTEHPVAANLLMAVMILFGIFSFTKLNTQFLPNYDINFVTVSIAWPGANAEDVANSITRPLEQELRSIDFLKEIKSKSSLGFSYISMEFVTDADMSDALNQVRELVNQVRNLPQDSERPVIKSIEVFEPVASMVVTGPNNINELRATAYRIERELLSLGIAKITISGLPDLQVSIEIPSRTLAELGLSLNQIAEQVRKKSEDVPAGTIGRGQLSKQLRALEQKRSLQEFGNIPLSLPKPDQLIYLKNISKIKLEPQEQESSMFYDGKPAVVIDLLRNRTANTLDNARILEKWQKEYLPKLGPNLKIHVYDERWILIKERINTLLKNGFSGLLLIIIILFLFLNIRIAWWVLVGIPTSFLAALGVLYFLGGSINMVSLFAIIMTLGIIVDDTIVVSEEALTLLQKGESILDAVTTGAKKMLVPIFSSSLTTICAFIPLLLISDIIGQILIEIPVVVICVILASLLECFLVLPGHLFHSLKHASKLQESQLRQRFNKGFYRFRDKVFKRVLLWSLRYSGFILTSVAALFILAIALINYGVLGFNFFPSPEGRNIYANIQFAAGTRPAVVNSFSKEVANAALKTEKQLTQAKDKIITTLIRKVNQSSRVGRNAPQYGEQFASVALELTSPDKRNISNQEFINAWQKNIRLTAGIESIKLTTPRAGPPGLDIDIKLSGNTLNNLKKASLGLMSRLQAESGVFNVSDDIPFGQNQLIFDLNSVGQALGLSIQDVSQQLRAAFSGALAEIYNTKDDEVEVRVQLPQSERDNLLALKRFPIITPAGKVVPLETIIKIDNKKGFDIIRHDSANPSIHVTAEVDSTINNENAILANLQKSYLPQFAKKYNVNYSFTGRSEDQQRTLNDMIYGLFIGLVLIYIILAWVFRSYGWPLIVMVAIPLGLTGAIFGHLIMGINLTLLSLFGLFGLSGIVVNDSIILLSTYKRVRKEIANANAAIVEATSMRFRAVLLTSMTTIAGLTPLMFETSLQAQFLVPMAVSIVFGLAYATLLILIVIPTMLSVSESALSYIHKKKTVKFHGDL